MASCYYALCFPCVFQITYPVMCWQNQDLLLSVLQNRYCCRRTSWVPPCFMHRDPTKSSSSVPDGW